MTLSIRDVTWWLLHQGKVVASAEMIDRARFEAIESMLVGHKLLVDLTNLWESSADIFELALPDGRILAITSEGDLDAEAGFDTERSRRWNELAGRH